MVCEGIQLAERVVKTLAVVLGMIAMWRESVKFTLNSIYNEVMEKSAITKENLCTKYFPFIYNNIALNEKPPIMKENLHIFFFIIGRVECKWQT